jgi:5-methylcytosine-specific restriction endonuclease McrA
MFDPSAARDMVGKPLALGRFCSACGDRRAKDIADDLARRRINVVRNLKAAYGVWWRHYTPPHFWAEELRRERDHCPYCGTNLPELRHGGPQGQLRAVLDHMDPVSLGGEDSLRNVIVCCSSCNSRKKNKSFMRWLSELPEPFRSTCRCLYVAKHQHEPELFDSTWDSYTTCSDGVPLFFDLDEQDFLREMRGMLPLAKGPPHGYLRDVLKPSASDPDELPQ